MNKFKQYSINALVIILVIFVLIVTFAKTIESMPDNTKVLISKKSKLYYSPMFFYDNRISAADSLEMTTLKEARFQKYKGSKRCRDEGYFTNYQGSVVWEWLDAAGIIKQKNRWNTDGTWNW